MKESEIEYTGLSSIWPVGSSGKWVFVCVRAPVHARWGFMFLVVSAVGQHWHFRSRTFQPF